MIKNIKNYIIHLLGGKTLHEFNNTKHVNSNGTLYGYIATDRNNKTYLYLNKPIKHNSSWVDCSKDSRFISFHNVELPSNIAPSWDDDEPIPVIIKIQKL